MNFNQILDSIRDAMIGSNTHDAILAVSIAALPVLLFLWIVNRQRHPERPFLTALGISLLGFVVVPSVARGLGLLWVRTGGQSYQALGIMVVAFIIGFCLFRHWLRSAPRRSKAPATPASLLASIHDTDPSGELAELRAEVARLRPVTGFGGAVPPSSGFGRFRLALVSGNAHKPLTSQEETHHG